MSSAEFTQWLAYYQLEPFGAYRDNIHAAMVASIVANANRDSKRAAFKVDDFMLVDQVTRKGNETRDFFKSLSAIAKPKEQ